MVNSHPLFEVATQYGDISGWLALAFIVVKEVIIPIIKKMIPVKAKLLSREEDRKDKEIEFDQQVKLRTVESLESLSKSLVQQTELFRVTNERLSIIEVDVKDIKQNFPPRAKKVKGS